MGLRNIIAHEYHRIDKDEIFRVITCDLQPLLEKIKKMKAELQKIDPPCDRIHRDVFAFGGQVVRQLF